MRTRLSRLPPWGWALAVVLLLLAVSPGRIIAYDVAVRAGVARALWSTGSLFVTDRPDLKAGLFEVAGRGGTSFYGVGQSLVFIPFDWLGRQLARVLDFPGTESLPLVWLYVPLIGLLCWQAIARVLSTFGLARRAALRLATLFLVSTVFLVYCGETAQEEALVATLLANALVHALRWARDEQRRDALALGAFASAALLVRLNAIFALLPLVGACLDGRRGRGLWRGAVLAVAGGLPALAVFAWAAHARYGSWLSTGYDVARAQGIGVYWTHPRAWLALALLLSPGKGLLALSPPLLFGAWGCGRLGARHRWYARGTLAALVAAALLCSRILNCPDGSECWSVRYLAHLGVFLAYPLAVALRAAPARLGRAVLALGIAINVVALFAPDTLEYQQSDYAGRERYQLIYSIADGQLPLRARNVATWMLHRTVASPRTPEIERLVSRYVPNVWGIAYSRRLGGSPAALVWAAWAGLVAAALSLVALGFAPARSARGAGRERVVFRASA